MTIAPNDNNFNQTFKPGFVYWVKHFSICFSRWKRYILLTIPIILVLSVINIYKYNKVKPKIESSVLVGSYQKTEYSFFPEYIENESISINFMRSRSFLKKIVDSLKLTFVLSDMYRSDIFSSIKLDTLAQIGTYLFEVKNSLSGYCYTVSSSKNNTNNPIQVFKGKLIESEIIAMQGVIIVFSKHYLDNPVSFRFTIVSKENAIEELRKNITIKQTPQKGHSIQNIVEITLTATDPQLTSATINLMADIYISENILFLKEKMHKTLTVLEKQLQTSTEQIAKSENNIKSFREKYPEITLDNNIYRTITELPVLDDDIFEKNQKFQQASDLKNRLKSASEELKAQVIIEALYFVSSQNVPGAIGLQEYFNYLLQQKFALETNEYAKGHRLVQENNQKIEQINTKTLSLLDDFIEIKKNELNNVNSEKKKALKSLIKLPEKEMQYAALLRQQLINSELYVKILSSYNQAKITDQDIISDFYVLDYSIPSSPELDIKRLMIFLISGILLSLLFSLGPALVYDFFDKKPYIKDDLYRFFSAPILEEIPSISSCQNLNCGINNLKIFNVNNKLSDEECFLDQTYNKIYAKIDSYLETQNSNALLITSNSIDDDCHVIAANLAIIAAQKYKKTLLIDSDIRHGMLFEYFNCSKTPGFSDLLNKELPLSILDFNNIIRYTIFSDLHLLCSGSPCKSPTNILMSNKLNELFKMSLINYKMIIVNSPPLSMVPDSYLLSRELLSCIVVIKAGKTDSLMLNKLIDEYPFLKEKIIGIILVDSIDNSTKLRKSFLKYKNNNIKQNVFNMTK